MLSSTLVFLSALSSGYASLASEFHCTLKLAVTPSCAVEGKTTFANVNHGIDLSKIKNVVPFGDSWTAMNDSDGLFPPPPPVIIGTNPMAGRRASNGPTWTEYIANDTNSQIHPYAVGGAVANLSNWPTAIARNISISDYISQMNIFIGQKRNFDPDSSLYINFFGINDHTYSLTDGTGKLLISAETIKTETLRLIQAGAKNILVAGVYFTDVGIPEFEQAIYDDLLAFRQDFGVNVAYVNFYTLWSSILSSKATAASYGYTSTSTCLVSDSTTVGACATPQTYLYWQHAHPSTCTHRLMADYAKFVLEHC